MHKRNVLSSPHLAELKIKKRRILIKKVLGIVFLFLVTFVGLGFASRWNKMNIKDVQIEGNKVVDTEVIRKLVEKEVEGYYLWLYPKTNFLFYPKGNIEERLREEFKILKDISTNVENTKTLKVSVSERTPIYTWCGDNLPLLDTEMNYNECYFMDEDGYIFDEAPYFSGEVYFKFYGSAKLGSLYLPAIFQNLILFKKTLESMGLKPVALFKEETENIKIFLSSRTSASEPEIIFKANANLEKIAENLQTALTTEPLQSNFKNKYSSLLYIDLSFGNKVYYKFSASE